MHIGRCAKLIVLLITGTTQASAQQKILVASISPQTLSSLSARYSLPSTSTSPSDSFISLRILLARITFFLRTTLGFDHVFDTTFARHVAISEHQREFFERREVDRRAKRGEGAEGALEGLPMLASACPGWICYAEKTHGELLPFVSRTKSPQQVMGTLVKRFIGSRMGVQADQIYHVTVMPCYDKKLEASRPDFYDDVLASRDVDCVLTTGELDRLMTEEGFDITQPVPDERADAATTSKTSLPIEGVLGGAYLPTPPDSEDAGSEVDATSKGGEVTVLPPFPKLLEHPGSSSGSYLFSLMRAVWQEWVDANADASGNYLPKLDVRTIRTVDYTEYVLYAPTRTGSEGEDVTKQGEVLFKGAQCYGFRNLQNLVRKIGKQTGVRSGRGAAASSINGKNTAGGRGRVRGGRGGMVKRGARAGAAAAAVTSDVSSAGDEERGYDYVEVMACPGGCVNGGGQLRPPTGGAQDTLEVGSSLASGIIATDVTEELKPTQPSAGKDEESAALDPEGFKEGWATPQSEDQESNEPPVVGWQGTSKEWVRVVERAYWSAAGSSFSSPQAVGGGIAASAGSARDALLRALTRAASDANTAKTDSARATAYADVLAKLVVDDLCASAGAGGEELPNGQDEQGKRRAREELLRTSYRAVQDQAVNGLAVQW